jgi:hypothetical protein
MVQRRVRAWGAVSLAVAALVAAFGADAATQRRYAGVITAVDSSSMTLAPVVGKQTITARIDPFRTKIVVNGHPGKAADLHVTHAAKAELCLDDVWLRVEVDASR